MKTGKRILILLLIFLVAAVVYFIRPTGGKEGQSITEYTTMEAARFPVLTVTMGERKMAPIFGQTEERGTTAGRGSLTVLSEDRKLPIEFSEASEITGLRYEVRSLDGNNLIERTELGDDDWSRDADGKISAELTIQNLLESGTQYRLGVCAALGDGGEVWYYTRIVELSESHVEEMLALAEEFSSKTYTYNDAQSLTMYMETEAGADGTSLGTVTLKDTFSQLTWGSLSPTRVGEANIRLKELFENLANVEVTSTVTTANGDTTETYEVTENFTMRWTNQRIYMMDYERIMTEQFSGDAALFSGKRITLGIGNTDEVQAKKSAGGQYTAFVTDRELWLYDSGENAAMRVFAFGGIASDDIRDQVPDHTIKILSLDEDGKVDFIVYGRMNRGDHEGSTGLAYYRYDPGQNELAEKFFLAAAEPFEDLKDDLSLLAYKNDGGTFYYYMNGGIYGIDVESLETVTVASELTKDRFAVSRDQSRVAWQEENEIWNSKSLQVMDFDRETRNELGGADGTVSRILGFVGNDLVYGSGDSGDYQMSNGRIMGLYLKSIDIVDQDMNQVMHYEKDGTWIREATVDDSRIHMKTVQQKDGFFGAYEEDTLVCNAEVSDTSSDAIGWYASDRKGQVLFVSLDREIDGTKKKVKTTALKLTRSSQALSGLKTTSQETKQSGASTEFYSYGRGRLLGKYTAFSDAAAAAYDAMGFVTAGDNRTIWIRGNRSGSWYIRDLSGAARQLERYREDFQSNETMEDGTFLLDASGATLSQVLYFVNQNLPVLAYTGEGDYLYLTGYDQTHVRVYHPESDSSETWSLETAEQVFGGAGNDFIVCISE